MGWVIVIIIVAILAGLLWWYLPQGTGGSATGTPATSTSTQAVAPTGSPSIGSSDAALTNDLSAIDAQMSAFASDNASVDGSLSDKPVQQSSL